MKNIISIKILKFYLIDMSFRKEKKFKLSYSDAALMQKNLIRRGMLELHPLRKVNSCYFDNEMMTLFLDSEEGVLPRKKVRIRWYNNLLNFKKETKISSIEGRYKYSENVYKIRDKSDIYKTKFFDPTYGKLSPKLIISYERRYFSLDKIRITMDTNIYYRHFLSKFKRIIADQESVMEIKTPNECSDDYIEKIIPYSSSRFSKYSRGILSFNKML